MTRGTTYSPACTWGALRLVFLVVVGFRHHIGPQALALAIERVRHRLDAAGFDARQLGDEIDDARQAGDVDRHLLFGDRQAREVRDLFDVLTGQAHIECQKCARVRKNKRD